MPWRRASARSLTTSRSSRLRGLSPPSFPGIRCASSIARIFASFTRLITGRRRCRRRRIRWGIRARLWISPSTRNKWVISYLHWRGRDRTGRNAGWDEILTCPFSRRRHLPTCKDVLRDYAQDAMRRFRLVHCRRSAKSEIQRRQALRNLYQAKEKNERPAGFQAKRSRSALYQHPPLSRRRRRAKSQLGSPRRTAWLRSDRLPAVSQGDEVRSVGSEVDRPRPLRVIERPCVGAAVRRAASDRLRSA